MVTLPIYLDSHATTPIDPRVLEAMLPFFTEHFGNPASRTHPFGWKAKEAVERAREQIATLVGASHREIVFTSGATEADNLAIKGVAEASRAKGDHLVTVATEHNAVLDTCRSLERRGWRVSYVPVAPDGLVDLDEVRRAITDRTVLVSVMAANNEIGVLQPLAEIGAIARERGVLVHTDAAQAVGKVPFDVNALRVDLASISAHKIYGPKGIGALYVRRRDPAVALDPQIHGGGHERGLRSGTLNVPAIAGFGKAAELCRQEMGADAARLGRLRDRLRDGLCRRVSDVRVNGSMDRRLPHNLNVSFAQVDGATLLVAMSDIAVSTGAACTSAAAEPSHAIRALGVSDDLARARSRT